MDGLLGASSGSGTVAAIAAISLTPGSTDPWSTTDSHQHGTLTTKFLSIIDDGFFDLEGSGSSDRVNVNGPVFLYGTLHVTATGTFSAGQSFTIIENDGTEAVYQTFAGLPEASVFYAGETKFRVTYVGGDGNDVVLTPVAPPIVKGKPNITITALSSGLIHGDSASFRVDVSSASNDDRVPAGGVTLSVDGTAAGTGTLASGSVTIAVSALSAGSHSITATYAGNDEFEGATGSITQTVAKAATSMSLESDANPARVGTTINITIRMSAPDRPALPVEGPVTVRSNGQIVSEVQLAGNAAVARIGPLAAGEYDITATYAGSNSVEVAQAALRQSVVKDDPTATATTLTQNRPVTEVHQPVTFTARVTSLNGVPAGTMTFTDGATTIGSVPLQNGVAELTVKTLALGTHTIVATYAGSESFATSASAPLVHAVVKGNPHIALISAASALVYGEPASFRIETSSIDGSVASGSVTLSVDGSVAGTGTLAGGAVTITVPLLTAGVHTISVVYEGNDAFGSATASITATVAKAKTIVSVDAGASPAFAGVLVDLAILVNASNPSLRIDGTVVVRGQDEVEVPLTANIARARIGPFEPGEYEIIATYPGNGNFEAGHGALTLSVAAPEPIFKQNPRRRAVRR